MTGTGLGRFLSPYFFQPQQCDRLPAVTLDTAFAGLIADLTESQLFPLLQIGSILMSGLSANRNLQAGGPGMLTRRYSACPFRLLYALR